MNTLQPVHERENLDKYLEWRLQIVKNNQMNF